MTNLPAPFLDPLPKPPGSTRQQTRDALLDMVLEPLPAAEASLKHGLHELTLQKALAKPEVLEYVNSLQAWKNRRDAHMRQGYLAEAIDEARELMRSAASDAVKLRAIEFLHRALAPKDEGGKAAPVFNLTQNIAPSTPAYDYVRPADLTSQPVSTQAIEDAQEIEKE